MKSTPEDKDFAGQDVSENRHLGAHSTRGDSESSSLPEQSLSLIHERHEFYTYSFQNNATMADKKDTEEIGKFRAPLLHDEDCCCYGGGMS